MNSARVQIPVCFLICILLIGALQHWSGATVAGFTAYPDEPSHYLGGLMVRDYLATGFPAAPRAFAVNYYLHLPFFAIGYWPPLFYIAEGLWMSVFGYGRGQVLLFLAVIGALIATTIFAVARDRLGTAGAFCCAILFLVIPDVLANNFDVMTDTAVALFSLWSVLALARYFKEPTYRHAILFGVLASCTIMTKYSGGFLALLPPLGVLLGRRWDLLRRGSFWIQPVIVAVLCGPWAIYTKEFVNTGYASFIKASFAIEVLTYIKLWGLEFGVALSILLFGAWIYQALGVAKADSLTQLLWIYPVAVLVFQSSAPVGVETRYLVPALAPLILLLAFSLARLPKWYAPALLAITVAGYSAVSLPQSRRSADGVKCIAQAIINNTNIKQALIYVPADEEGLMIAEFAMQDPRRPVRILARPNKLIAAMDWNANYYVSDYERPEDLEHYFEENPPDLVILHPRQAKLQFPHERLLETTVQQNPACWKLVIQTCGHDVYQFTGPRKTGDRGMTPGFRHRIGGRFEYQ